MIEFEHGFLVLSDGHQQPDEEPLPALVAAVTFCSETGIPLVLNGDWLDLVIHSKQEYIASPILGAMYHLFTRCDVWYIPGNHEGRTALVADVLQGFPLTIVPSLDVAVAGVPWHVEHGDRFAADWSWLRPVYQGIAATALTVCPRQWELFCRRWSPKAALNSGETEKYSELTGVVWSNALRYATKNQTNVVLGHTHTACTIKAGRWVADGGDARDGSGIEICGNGEPHTRWFSNRIRKGFY
ncbi:MAG: hypothetical protein WC657_07040 [Candidatus Paceibacterota bacterium]